MAIFVTNFFTPRIGREKASEVSVSRDKWSKLLRHTKLLKVVIPPRAARTVIFKSFHEPIDKILRDGFPDFFGVNIIVRAVDFLRVFA